MNYKRLLAVTVIGGLLAHGALVWLKKPEIKNINSTGSSVVAFGDSLVYGVGASKTGE